MRLTRTVLAVTAALIFWLAGARAAHAKQVKYVGPHPVAQEAGGGYCYIEVPHVHVYAPAKADVLFRAKGDAYYFVGDPVPFGYDGPKEGYYGPHPIPANVLADDAGPTPGIDSDDYCYLQGPHYHYYAPPPTMKFVVKGGVHWYVGDLPAAFTRDSRRFARINVVYRPMVYARPVVIETPPPEYRPPVLEVDVVGTPPSASATVDVEPAPVAVVGGAGVGVVGGGGIAGGLGFGVGLSAGVEVNLPPPPSASVEVRFGAPPPVQVVEVRGPAPVQVVEVRGRHREYHGHGFDEREEHEHHDNGKHEGHHEHGRGH